MKRSKRLFWLLALGSSFALGAWAVGRTDSARHELAAKLLRVMKMERDLTVARESIGTLMVRSDPSLAPYTDVVREWMESTASWDEVSSRMIPLYAEAFDEEQLEGMIAFYESPVGQRALDVLPTLMQTQLEIGAALAQEHAPELRRRMREKQAQLEGATAGEPQKSETDDERAAHETSGTLRNVGTAMFSWITDRIADPDYRDRSSSRNAAGPRTWAGCPAISYDDLRALLVPTYEKELPRQDAWGRDLQFCLDRDSLLSSRLVAGIRSAGSDGRFRDAAADLDDPGDGLEQDLVWLDGFLIEAPARPGEG